MTIVHTRARYNYPSILAYSLLTLLFSVSLIFLPIDILKGKESLVAMIPLFLIFGMLGLWTLRMTLWFLIGEESLHLENEELIIRRKGTFWIRKERRIPLLDIKVVGLRKTMIQVNSPSTTVHFFARHVMYIFFRENWWVDIDGLFTSIIVLFSPSTFISDKGILRSFLIQKVPFLRMINSSFSKCSDSSPFKNQRVMRSVKSPSRAMTSIPNGNRINDSLRLLRSRGNTIRLAENMRVKKLYARMEG